MNGRIYRQWGGDPKGKPEDPTRCIQVVFPPRRYVGYQCDRKRGHGPDGLYCRQHGKKEEQRRESLAVFRIKREQNEVTECTEQHNRSNDRGGYAATDQH